MLLDTLVDTRILCWKVNQKIHLKILWGKSKSSQNLKLAETMKMFILTNSGVQAIEFCQELYNLSNIFG